MRTRRRIILALLAAIILAGLAAPLLAAPFLEDIPGVAELHWRTASQMLPSGGTVAVPQGAKLVVGADAAALQQLTGGTGPSPEASLRFSHYGMVNYYRCNCGYIRDDDWQCIKPDEVLASLTPSYLDMQGADVLGWAIAPSFDPATVTITYMLHLRSDGLGEYYDGDAMILGRYGMEILEASSRKKDYATTLNTLRKGIAAFRFARGYRYGDYVAGDTISQDHIAKKFLVNAFAADLALAYTDCRISQAEGRLDFS
jgi:uncharacterized membrane-anchored protein